MNQSGRCRASRRSRQQLPGEVATLGGEHGPVGPLRRQGPQPLWHSWIRPVQRQPVGAIRLDRLPAHILERGLQDRRAPAPVGQGQRQGLVVSDARGTEGAGMAGELRGHQHHLPPLVDQRAQPGEGGGSLLGEGQIRRQPQGRLAGRPPVLRHAVDEYAVEVEHQQRAGDHTEISQNWAARIRT